MSSQTLGGYELGRVLGSGGMGIVYEAHDVIRSRTVAVKVLQVELARDVEAIRRFKREAATIARLHHPNVCQLYETGQHKRRHFIAMERAEGVNLREHLLRRTLDDREIVDIGVQIASALEAAHAAFIVHRDIKPGNIMISPAGKVKVLDFGLARPFRLDDAGEPGLYGSTIRGRPIGTANYMAPERILQLPLDPRSDLFSLGVVIYEMATGQLPFAGTSPAETVTNILEKDPIALGTRVPARLAGLSGIVSRLLARRAGDRYQTAAQVRHALLELVAPPTFLHRHLPKRVRR